MIDRDESIRADTTMEALGALRPAFRKDGTVTAGNAPPVNDGAAALVRHVRCAGGGALAAPHGPHRRPGVERPGAEVRPDDAGRGRAAPGGEDQLEARRGRPVRAERSVLGAGGRRAAGARHRPAEGERQRRRGRTRPPDRRQRRAYPDDPVVRAAATRPEARHRDACVWAAATGSRSRWSESSRFTTLRAG